MGPVGRHSRAGFLTEPAAGQTSNRPFLSVREVLVLLRTHGLSMFE